MRALVLVALVLAACSASRPTLITSAPPANTTAAVVTDDVRLISAMYAVHNAAWETGPEAGCDATIASAYPPMRAAGDYKLTRADCLAATFHGAAPVASYREVEQPDLGTLARADGWMIPVGSLRGAHIDGRIYTLTLRTLAGIPQQPFVETVHVVVADGKAYDFTTYAR